MTDTDTTPQATGPAATPGDPDAVTEAPTGLPGLWKTSVARSVVELKSFFRNKQSLVFTLLFPIMLLLVLGAIFSGTVEGTNVDFKQVFMSGIVAGGVMSVAFSGLAINIAIELDNGTIRRLAATPMPKTAYFIGKVVRVLVTTLLETVLLIAFAVLFFDLPLPATGERWLTLSWVLALGTIACALLAVAYSWLIPNSRSAAAIVTPPFLVLQFISGVFFPFNQLPAWMQTLAAFFPLKWMAQGFRSVFLPDSFTIVEPAHSWELDRIALMLGVWCVISLVLCVLTFRWRGPKVR